MTAKPGLRGLVARVASLAYGCEMVAVALAGRQPIHLLRVLVLRCLGASIGPGATLYHGMNVRNARGLVIGERASIGDRATLDARGGLNIGANVNLSTEVQIWTGDHDWKSADFGYRARPVSIGDRAWISARAIILPGVTVGAGAVIAAGAVVASDVAPFTLVAGVPAKYVADRPDQLSYDLPSSHHKVAFW